MLHIGRNTFIKNYFSKNNALVVLQIRHTKKGLAFSEMCWGLKCMQDFDKCFRPMFAMYLLIFLGNMSSTQADQRTSSYCFRCILGLITA